MCAFDVDFFWLRCYNVYIIFEKGVFLMLDQNDLQAIAVLIKNEVEPINNRLDKIDTRLDNIETRLERVEDRLEKVEEDIEITRDVTNSIGEWVDFYFHDDKPYPLDEDEMEKYKNGLKFAK